MTSVTLAQKNRSAESPSWLRSSVLQFFAAINWDDHPLETQPVKLTALADSDAPLSLALSVSQFFTAINWDGTTIAAPTPSQDPTPPPANDLTLDDFSSLF